MDLNSIDDAVAPYATTFLTLAPVLVSVIAAALLLAAIMDAFCK